jgi:hypothetical protein
VNDTNARLRRCIQVFRRWVRVPTTRSERQIRGAVPDAVEAVMGTGDLKVHDKDRALFDRIEEALSAYEQQRDETVPDYLAGYAAELDHWHADTLAARRTRR